LCADADAAFVESLDGDLIAFAGSPRTFYFGTRQSSRISSQVEEARMPSLIFFLSDGESGEIFSIRNAVMPLYPAEGSMWLRG